MPSLPERIEAAEGRLEYHLLHYEVDVEQSAYERADKHLSMAAQWAAIVTALRAKEQPNEG